MLKHVLAAHKAMVLAFVLLVAMFSVLQTRFATAAVTGTLTVSPNPVTACESGATAPLTFSWRVSSVTSITIRAGSASGEAVSTGYGTSGAAVVTRPVGAPVTYYLTSTSAFQPLASATVNPSTQGCAPLPTPTSLPDFTVTDGSVTPKLSNASNAIEINKDALVKFTVKNQGNASANAPSHEILYEGITPYSQGTSSQDTCVGVATLGAGQSCNVALTVRYNQLSTQTQYPSIRINLDPRGNVVESDENNNWMVLSFDVRAANSVPSITSLSQTSGGPGTSIIIYGTDLGLTGQATIVKFGNTSASYALGAGVNIQGVIVPALSPGTYPVTVQVGSYITNSINFVVTALAAYECDVYPRDTGGDGKIDTNDYYLVGQFSLGNLTATPGLEFQKADCAPRSSGGDGRIDVADWVQAGRYASNLDPLQTASGPTSPVIVQPPVTSVEPQPTNTPPVAAGDATREQVAVAMFNTFGVSADRPNGWPQTLATSPSFTDVSVSNPNWKAMEVLKEQGITSGCVASPLQYCPSRVITRAEIAVMLARALKLPLTTDTQKFTDVPRTHWAYTSVEAIAKVGVTAGCTTTTFCPDSPVTAVQLDTFMSRAKALLPPPPPTNANKPQGYLDSIDSSGNALGWSFDLDDPSKSIVVHFYLDGVAGQGTSLGTAIADTPRTDVNNAFGITGNHGYSFAIPAQYKDGKTHTLYAYGIDSGGLTANNMLLTGSPKSFIFGSATPFPTQGTPQIAVGPLFNYWVDPATAMPLPAPGGPHPDFPNFFMQANGDSLWSTVSSSSQIYEIYGEYLTQMAWLKYRQPTTGSAVMSNFASAIKRNNKQTAIQAGGVDWTLSCNPDTAAQLTFDSQTKGTFNQWADWKNAGGTLDYIIFDNQVDRSVGSGTPCNLTIAQAARGQVAFFKLLRDTYFPNAKLEFTEAINYYNVKSLDYQNGNVSAIIYPGSMNINLEAFIDSVNTAAQALGVTFYGYVFDHDALGGDALRYGPSSPYYFADQSGLAKHARDYGRILAAEKMFRDKGIKTGFYFTVISDANLSEPQKTADFIRRAVTMVSEYKSIGGKSEFYHFTHWSLEPLVTGSETTPNTVWNLILQQIQKANEATVPLPPPLLPPVTDSKLGVSTVHAFSTIAGSSMSYAVDGNTNTYWNSGKFPSQWIELDLGSVKTVKKIKLQVEQSPNGMTTHQLYLGTATWPNQSLVYTFSGNTSSGQWLEYSLQSPVSARYLSVVTASSPSWVAWREVEVYGE